MSFAEPSNIIHQVALTTANFSELECRLGRVPTFDEYAGSAVSVGQITYRLEVRSILLELYRMMVLPEFARCIQTFAAELTEEKFYNDCLSLGVFLFHELKLNRSYVSVQELFEKIEERFPGIRKELNSVKIAELLNDLQETVKRLHVSASSV